MSITDIVLIRSQSNTQGIPPPDVSLKLEYPDMTVEGYNSQPNVMQNKETEALSQPSPMQKRSRGRPRKIFTVEQRKAARAQYYQKRLEKRNPTGLNQKRPRGRPRKFTDEERKAARAQYMSLYHKRKREEKKRFIRLHRTSVSIADIWLLRSQSKCRRNPPFPF